MNEKKLFLGYLSGYFLIRFFSFFFPAGNAINTLASTAIVFLVAILLFKNKELALSVVAAELLLGGSGIFFQIASISVRTILLLVVGVFYLTHYPRKVLSLKPVNLIIFCLLGIGLLGAINGLENGNGVKNILTDFIPYLFLFYYFVFADFLNNEKLKALILPAVFAAATGGLFFILFTFFGFSSGIFILQDPYYHWFRDVAGGKITFVEFNFYRLVLNEHLVLATGFLASFYEYLRAKKHKYFLLGSILLMILSINLTRVYFLAIALGALALISKTNFRFWAKSSAYFAMTFILFFSTLFLTASRGQSFGLEVFGLRLQSIVQPNIENSSLSRILLLPEIFKKIGTSPFLGTGLGSTISVYSPVFKEIVTTPHFDWGYLEILTELGAIGAAIWLSLIIFIFLRLKKQPMVYLAVLFAMLVINITSPALFHVFGFIIIALLLSVANRISEAPNS